MSKKKIIAHQKTASGYDTLYPDTSIDNINSTQEIADAVGASATDGQSIMESISYTDKMISGYGVTAGTAKAYTLSLEGKPDMAIVDGMMIRARFHMTSDEEPTIDVNGSGAKNIYSEDGLKLLGQIGRGVWVLLMYSEKLSGWVLQGFCKRSMMHTEIITESQTWNVPEGVSIVNLKLFGGGGAGGGGYGTEKSGGGGGGGHMATGNFTLKKKSYEITIGAGAKETDPGSSGRDGGTTSFGDLLSANGGAGGGGYSGEGGSGGTGGGCTYASNSGAGGRGYYGGGGGGGGCYGNGGAGGTYGGGGGGGGRGIPTTPSVWQGNGGTGRNGIYSGGAGYLTGYQGGGGGGYSGNGQIGDADNGGKGGNGQNTIGLGLEFEGEGKGGNGYHSSIGTTSHAGGGGGGGYGGNGGNGGNTGGGGGGGYGGNGGNGDSAGGGGGGYGGNGGNSGSDYYVSGAPGGGGGYGVTGNGGNGGRGNGGSGTDGGVAAGGGGGAAYTSTSVGRAGYGGAGGNGICIITYWTYD